MNSFPKPTEPPLAGDAGVSAPSNEAADPYRALGDLMAVVEALCPVWPEREIFQSPDRMLL